MFGDTNYMDITCKAPPLFTNVTNTPVVPPIGPSLVLDMLHIFKYVYGTMGVICVLFAAGSLLAIPFVFIYEAFDEIADAFPPIMVLQLGKYFD